MRRRKYLRSKTPIRRKTPLRAVNPERRRWLYEHQYGGYADIIRSLACCVCWRPGPSDPHHVRSRNAGGSKRDLVPLCRQCHDRYHSIGRNTFAERFNVDLAEIAKKLWRKHGDKA